ncbi:hypothetical protein GQ600_9391 [Phytophthora cactorum]|nr:hypothetical protein GQ600_9391 [Phytophthora cactorum]
MVLMRVPKYVFEGTSMLPLLLIYTVWAIRAAQSNGNESAECLTDAIEAFKFSNPSWDRYGCIFPHVKVILCYFHLRRHPLRNGQEQYGGPSSFDMARLKTPWHVENSANERGLHKVPQVPVFPAG